ncbi:MAG: PhzF family phenazine biosynthesis protein [bacterium]|nr:PhzF family phenazine biosynthesis protein [bacterium]
MKWPYLQVNVFSLDPLKGNPLAVIRPQVSLDSQRMQDFARWTNLSETVFIEPSEVADYKIRLFTPQQEIPFAGHPSLGALYCALAWGMATAGRERYLQECAAGQVELKALGPSDYIVRMPEAHIRPLKPVQERLMRKLLRRELATGLVVELGPKWLVSEVESLEVLYQKSPAPSEVSALSLECGVSGLTLFYRDAEGNVELRSFAPTAGVIEDPVCGSGNGAVAAYLREKGVIQAGSRYQARQGQALGREGEVAIELTEGGIWVGGRVQAVIEGEVEGL